MTLLDLILFCEVRSLNGHGMDPECKDHGSGVVFKLEPSRYPGVLMMAPHAQYRMDLRGITEPEVRRALGNAFSISKPWPSSPKEYRVGYGIGELWAGADGTASGYADGDGCGDGSGVGQGDGEGRHEGQDRFLHWRDSPLPRFCYEPNTELRENAS